MIFIVGIHVESQIPQHYSTSLFPPNKKYNLSSEDKYKIGLIPIISLQDARRIPDAHVLKCQCIWINIKMCISYWLQVSLYACYRSSQTLLACSKKVDFSTGHHHTAIQIMHDVHTLAGSRTSSRKQKEKGRCTFIIICSYFNQTKEKSYASQTKNTSIP